MRLFYLRLKLPRGLQLLAGQYHDLFAWGGAGFYPHSVAFLGIAGQVYHRNPQIRPPVGPACCVTSTSPPPPCGPSSATARCPTCRRA